MEIEMLHFQAFEAKKMQEISSLKQQYDELQSKIDSLTKNESPKKKSMNQRLTLEEQENQRRLEALELVRDTDYQKAQQLRNDSLTHSLNRKTRESEEVERVSNSQIDRIENEIRSLQNRIDCIRKKASDSLKKIEDHYDSAVSYAQNTYQQMIDNADNHFEKKKKMIENKDMTLQSKKELLEVSKTPQEMSFVNQQEAINQKIKALNESIAISRSQVMDKYLSATPKSFLNLQNFETPPPLPPSKPYIEFMTPEESLLAIERKAAQEESRRRLLEAEKKEKERQTAIYEKRREIELQEERRVAEQRQRQLEDDKEEAAIISSFTQPPAPPPAPPKPKKQTKKASTRTLEEIHQGVQRYGTPQ
jgi:hypothetical protein